MINSALINPNSIAIIGASNNQGKPGGVLVRNLKKSFSGNIYPVNPKESKIQGLTTYKNMEQLPQTELAVLAIPAYTCTEVVQFLAKNRGTKAFIIISAGFSETGPEGEAIEKRLKKLVEEHELALVGPNCIGIINPNYSAVFVSPLPLITGGGADFVSASGALAVFLFETAARSGLRFHHIFSVGNSLDITVEDVLKHWDENFEKETSSTVKMVYVEQIRKPQAFYKHVNSLQKKGCQVIVLKPGDSEAATRAVLSHTGALAGDGEAMGWLIGKAGAIRCYSREELVSIAAILMQKPLKGKRIAVVTHAGGPAVILADQLSKLGFEIPALKEQDQKAILDTLNPGASAVNPIDMLATAHYKHLEYALSYCDRLGYIDGIVVIYGSTGMENLNVTYNILNETISHCEKPVYPVLPSIQTASKEIDNFIELGNVTFPDEVNFARALSLAVNAPRVDSMPPFKWAGNCKAPIKEPVPLQETEVWERLERANIPTVPTRFINTRSELDQVKGFSFPVVAKVMGILHKTEVNGVQLNIQNDEELDIHFQRLRNLEGSTGVLVQEMKQGIEVYLGGKCHPGLGYSVHVGMGGVFVELIRDVTSNLAPVNEEEAMDMLSNLRTQKLFSGFRNMPAIDKGKLAEVLTDFSKIFGVYPDITEIDLNPCIVNKSKIWAVDARIIASK